MQSLLYGRIQVAYSDSGDIAWSGLEASQVVLGGHGDVAITLPASAVESSHVADSQAPTLATEVPARLLTRTLRDAYKYSDALWFSDTLSGKTANF